MKITIEVKETEPNKYDHPGDIHARVVGLKVAASHNKSWSDELHLTTDTGFTYVLMIDESLSFKLSQTGWR